MSRPMYTVRAQRHGAWWLLTVPELTGVVSQVKSLAQADDHVREAIAFVSKQEPESFDITLEPHLPDDVAAEAREARIAVRKAEEEQARAAEASRAVARKLKAMGLSGRDAGILLGISQQRFSQLVTGS